MPARSPRVKKGLKELIQILHLFLRRVFSLLLAFVVLGFLFHFFLNPSISIFQYFSAIAGAGNLGFR